MGTFILGIPERLSMGLRKIKDPDDRIYVMTALFWAVILTAENADSKYAGKILHQAFSEQAYHQFIEPCYPDSAEDPPPTDNPDRLYEVFEKFSQHIDVYCGWPTIYRFFFEKIDLGSYISDEDVQFELEVNPHQNFLQIEVF